ncbi:ABC transporter permease [Pseudotabrizicola sp. 4114]|uniref:ABC transporter permease n=1 Tax=Pseudotabrizicola sp. 4114 TaxID=2817731 RepID=UPI002855ABB9|nr:peptide/nickel transport system permease protein/oligopeptide transport system permease protein [Pseudorhodobacter sp. 4114]
MLIFVLRRLIQSVFVMLAVSLLAFVLFQFAGDPIEAMVGQDATMADRAALRDRLGLDDPVVFQFARFIGNAVQGEFGLSYRLQQPVLGLIMQRLPATVELAVTSTIIALVLGTALGVLTALKNRSWITGIIMAVSLVGISLPTFLIGIGLIYVFAVELHWLPSFGRGQVVELGGWSTGFLTSSGLRSLILPSFTLALFQTALLMRLIRAEMLEVLRQDYIRFARARGLSERVINFRHALKNTLVPVITVAGLMLGSIIAFSVVTESVFQWPGVGSLFIASVQAVDVPVMSVYLMFIALLFVTINFVVDILYFIVDPRLRADSQKRA